MNCNSGRDEVIELLIKHGSNVSAKDCYGNTALHVAALGGIKLKQSGNRNLIPLNGFKINSFL